MDGIFKKEDFFPNLCKNSTDFIMNQTTSHNEGPCNARLEKLNLVFLVSASLICFTNFPAGAGLDYFGARKMRMIAM